MTAVWPYGNPTFLPQGARTHIHQRRNSIETKMSRWYTCRSSDSNLKKPKQSPWQRPLRKPAATCPTKEKILCLVDKTFSALIKDAGVEDRCELGCFPPKLLEYICQIEFRYKKGMLPEKFPAFVKLGQHHPLDYDGVRAEPRIMQICLASKNN